MLSSEEPLQQQQQQGEVPGGDGDEEHGRRQLEGDGAASTETGACGAGGTGQIAPGGGTAEGCSAGCGEYAARLQEQQGRLQRRAVMQVCVCVR